MTAGVDVALRPVDEANRAAVLVVAPRPEQGRFVAPVAQYLASCKDEGVWQPFALVVDGEVVGFAMWAIDDDASRWIGGVVVDAAHQGRGIGRGAVESILAMFRDQAGATGAAMTCAPDNLVARGLYERLGFRATGEMDDDEVVLRLRF